MSKLRYSTLQEAIAAQLQVLDRYGEMQSIYKDGDSYSLTSRRRGESRHAHRVRKQAGIDLNLHAVNLI